MEGLLGKILSLNDIDLCPYKCKILSVVQLCHWYLLSNIIIPNICGTGKILIDILMMRLG